MKSLWKNLVQSALVVGLAASLTGTLIAQDAGQAGIVRISRPKMSDVVNRQVTPTGAMMMSESCNTATGSPSSGGCDPSSSGVGSGYNNGQGSQYCEYPADNSWGSGFRRHTRGHSAAFNSMCFGNSCPPGGMYYHDPSGQAMLDYFKCKFGYFIPTGGGGAGLPWVGHYSRVYPVTPYHSPGIWHSDFCATRPRRRPYVRIWLGSSVQSVGPCVESCLLVLVLLQCF